jgi:hypothetical protein
MALAMAPARAQPGAPAQATRVFLPQIGQPAAPPATVRFGSGLSGGALSGVGTSFPAGLPALYYEVTVADGAGLPFRLEWTIAGTRRPELDRAGLLPADGTPLTGGITRSTGEPLPAGVYTLRVLVEGLYSGTGQARLE